MTIKGSIATRIDISENVLDITFVKSEAQRRGRGPRAYLPPSRTARDYPKSHLIIWKPAT